MFDRLRLRYGIRWSGKYPPIPWREILMAILLVLIYGLVDRVNHLTEEKVSMVKAAQYDNAAKDALIGCLNGRGFYFPDTKKTYLCETTEI